MYMCIGRVSLENDNGFPAGDTAGEKRPNRAGVQDSPSQSPTVHDRLVKGVASGRSDLEI